VNEAKTGLPTGAKIRLFRILYRFSQEELGLLTGVKQRMIVAYEKNQFRTPRHVIDRISSLFSLNAEWLLENHAPVFTQKYVLLRLTPPKDRTLQTRKKNELIDVLGDLFKKFLIDIKVSKALCAATDNDILYLFLSGASHFFVAGARMESIFDKILSDANVQTKRLSLSRGAQIDSVMAEMVKAAGLEPEIFAKEAISASLRQWDLHQNVLRDYEKTIKQAKIREVCDLMKKYAIALEELRTHCQGD
jgi:transcriptional regulator with XRE-family HTH domain